MVINPAGYVPIFDGGAPRIITGIARSGITAGDLVFVSGAADAVSSGANSFATADITFMPDASGALFNGISLGSYASGATASIATRGVFIVIAAGTVVAGELAGANGIGGVVARGVTNQGSGALIGRLLSGAASGGFVLLDLHG